jgi:hypothetical protein
MAVLACIAACRRCAIEADACADLHEDCGAAAELCRRCVAACLSIVTNRA